LLSILFLFLHPGFYSLVFPDNVPVLILGVLEFILEPLDVIVWLQLTAKKVFDDLVAGSGGSCSKAAHD
jgi:hypothetical protein